VLISGDPKTANGEGTANGRALSSGSQPHAAWLTTKPNIVCIGPCSSLFDYTTYFMMLYVFHCWDTSTPEAARRSASLFQTGWFVESLLTQTLVIYIIRTNKIPFLQSRPSWPLMVMSSVIAAIGVAIPFSSVGAYLGFTPLPTLYWPLLAVTLVCYAGLTQGVKMWLLRKKWI
jgi:Mg2+-importing ATPase